MKHCLKGIAAAAIVLIISLVIHVFCNMNEINLNTPLTAIASAGLSIAIYHLLIRNEKK